MNLKPIPLSDEKTIPTKNVVVIQFDQAPQPKFKEDKAKGFVRFGDKNDYSDYLLDMYAESPKHGAIIKGKVNYIFGKGFETLKKVSANANDEYWDDLAKKAINDDEIHNGYYLQIVWNRMGRIQEVYHIPFQNVRSNKNNTRFYVKDDWKDYKEKAREYPAFNLLDKSQPQILFVKWYNPKNKTYPLPDYLQGMNYIDTDVEISRHILGNAKQGFVGSTLINLNNGNVLSEEEKEDVEDAIKEKFTGSGGSRLMLMFNPSRDNASEVSSLGSTMLTKEDFTNVNNLVQQEIFAAHRITSPMLFGIKTEGQLGGRGEIREAYEIFNNTYVTERQQKLEETFNKLFLLAGIQGEHKITPVEPLGFEFSENIMKENMTRDEIREKMGLEPDGLQSTQVPGSSVVVNNHLQNITGKQQQQLLRIVRQFMQGKLTKQQAVIQLTPFGMTAEEIDQYLGLDDDPHTNDQQFSDDTLLMEFSACGETLDGYEIIHSEPAKGSIYFKEVDTAQLEANVLSMIQKDKRISNELIAESLNVNLKVVAKIVSDLVAAGSLTSTVSTIGEDEIIERELTQPIRDITDEKPTVTEILIRYSYDWKPEVPAGERNSAAHPSRPFCVRLMELNKLYSRQDIESISARVGYSVWDRKGGWWTQPDGSHSPECRHMFKINLVTKKK